MMAMSRDICEFRPPPFPPRSSEMYQPLYDYIKSNETYWCNYINYHDWCKIPLPFEPSSTASRDITTSGSSEVSVVVSTRPPDSISVGSANIALPIMIALIIVGLVIGLVLYGWWRVKWKRRRENLPTLPLKEYETTNYLDNKARNNQCWNPKDQQEPELAPSMGTGSLDVGCVIEKVVAVVEPFSEVNTDKLMISKGFNDENSTGNKLGCENLSFTNDSNENRSPVSAGACSMTPLYDSTDGGLLPNVPEMSLSDKHGNHYTPFPQLPNSNNTNITLHSRLPPINTKDDGCSGNTSPKYRNKLNSSPSQRTSEPLTNSHLMCEDLIENRKSV